MSPKERFEYAQETHRMALANHDRALALYDLIWPWRWHKWFREHRAIRATMREVERRRDVFRAELDAPTVTEAFGPGETRRIPREAA